MFEATALWATGFLLQVLVVVAQLDTWDSNVEQIFTDLGLFWEPRDIVTNSVWATHYNTANPRTFMGTWDDSGSPNGDIDDAFGGNYYFSYTGFLTPLPGTIEVTMFYRTQGTPWSSYLWNHAEPYAHWNGTNPPALETFYVWDYDELASDPARMTALQPLFDSGALQVSAWGWQEFSTTPWSGWGDRRLSAIAYNSSNYTELENKGYTYDFTMVSLSHDFFLSLPGGCSDPDALNYNPDRVKTHLCTYSEPEVLSDDKLTKTWNFPRDGFPSYFNWMEFSRTFHSASGFVVDIHELSTEVCPTGCDSLYVEDSEGNEINRFWSATTDPWVPQTLFINSTTLRLRWYADWELTGPGFKLSVHAACATGTLDAVDNICYDPDTDFAANPRCPGPLPPGPLSPSHVVQALAESVDPLVTSRAHAAFTKIGSWPCVN